MRRLVLACLALATTGILGGCSPIEVLQSPWEKFELAGDSPAAPPGGPLISDTASGSDPLPVWGAIDCESSSRVAHFAQGGDAGDTAGGAPQANSAFRRMTVIDGDDFYGERCELGANDLDGPVVFYEEGQRRVTSASFRLPDNFPLETADWQGVLQMKQTQTSDNGGGTPVLSMGAYGGEWIVFHSGPGYTEDGKVIWTTPARRGIWTRFEIDAVYSQDPARGSVQVRADLNADGDFHDQGERSPLFRTNTLKRETGAEVDEADGLSAGESIPSHLRVGIYHNPVIRCPAPRGCSVDMGNVQVLGR